MDLRYFAGQILINTEIGKNLSMLPARLNKLFLVHDSVTLEKLLSFKENSVPGLYAFNMLNNTFRLEHNDGEYLARASAVLNPLGVKFCAEFLEENLTEYGISYVGIIRIHHPSEYFDIKVPGELSYDPACVAGDKMWVDYHQVNKIVVFVALLVKAALLGATKKFLKRLYVVSKPIIARYYQKEELFRWMYKQVKNACIFKKKPISYGEHLQKVELRCTGNVQSYLASLEMLKKGEIQEMLPPPEFFKAITEESYVDNSYKSKVSDLFEQRLITSTENEDSLGIPTIQEMNESLFRVKIRYEKEVSNHLSKIQDLINTEGKQGKIKLMVTIQKPFKSQCPIF